ncbi:TonB C-terminal domain-containing protein [Candidatus Dependentiae bacterium]|nr:TonB C-terminal domain-containing protein [Candidatus Dependentiae bacterium]
MKKKPVSKSKKVPAKPKPKKVVTKKIPEKKADKKEVDKKKKDKQEEQKKEEVIEKEEMLHFNLMGESDPRVIVYQQCIQVEVDRVWKPPLGVPKGTECEVFFVVSRDGSIKEFAIQKSSHVLIYDLSIIRVGKQFKFDRCLWGKSFAVTFRQ